jgi:hypothetical protein
MKKEMMFLFLGIFLIGFACAAYGDQSQYSNANDEVVTTSGTQNQIQTNIELREENRERVRDGNYSIDGKTLRVERQDEMRTRLQSDSTYAESELEIEEKTNNSKRILQARLSNGRNAEIKIMPDTASQTALARLRLKVCSTENNCTIELKEVGQLNQTRLAYELRAEKQSKVFGLFRARMQVQSQIDAENGEVIQEKRPWWSFLATDDETTTEEVVEESLE